jgi:hypothetical protein
MFDRAMVELCPDDVALPTFTPVVLGGSASLGRTMAWACPHSLPGCGIKQRRLLRAGWSGGPLGGCSKNLTAANVTYAVYFDGGGAICLGPLE